jgi:hypothetical protein
VTFSSGGSFCSNSKSIMFAGPVPSQHQDSTQCNNLAVDSRKLRLETGTTHLASKDRTLEQQLFSRLHCTRCAITYITFYYLVPPANPKVKPDTGSNYGLATSPHHSDPARTPLSRGFLYLGDFLQPLVPIRRFDPGKEIKNIDRDIRVYRKSLNAGITSTLKCCTYIFPA